MLMTLLALGAGLVLGFLCAGDRHRLLHRRLGRAGRVATAALMLCIGIWLGANPAFWSGLRTAGPAGVALALAASGGSVALGWVAARALGRGRRS